MNRVSSRQRLVSWDAFDATARYNDSSSSDEEVLSEYQTCVDESAMLMVSPSSSWATLNGDAMDSNYSPCADTTMMMVTVGGHKRDRAARRDSSNSSGHHRSLLPSRGSMTALNAPTVLKSATPTTTTPLQFHDLASDTQLHIMSFLDVSSLRAVMATSHCERRLLISKDAHFIWMDWIQHLWPKLVLQPAATLMDSMQLPTAMGQFEQHDTNIALLLSLAALRHSTTIDTDLFQPSTISYNLRSMRRQGHRHHATLPSSQPLFVMYENETTNMTIVQFCGDVGVGDRCIRAKEPLARPLRRVASTTAYQNYYTNHYHHQNQEYLTPSNPLFFLHGLPLQEHHFHFYHHHHHLHHLHANALQPYQYPETPLTTAAATPHTRMSLLDMICRGSKAVSVVDASQQQAYWHWKPFVTPHVVMNPTKDGKILLDLTPRLVSYFEVSILSDSDLEKSTTNNNHENGHGHSTVATPPRHSVRSECVAVGVASHYFDVHSRMPGWDSFSFGYHGDDGGIFHASGGMLRPYGPRFGVGDTVGCGIDYTNGGIFFTLNSKFLGYAWTGISTSLYLQQDLYPVVGVDSHAPISCNFGERPFGFDLSTFIQQHAPIVKDACCGLSSMTGSSSLVPTARETVSLSTPSPRPSRRNRG